MIPLILTRPKSQKFKTITTLALGFTLLIFIQANAQELSPKNPEQVWSSDKRYSDNGDQTISDTKSGLMWVKMDSYLHTGHWINWNEAKTYVADLNKKTFAGYIDWKLPTVKELQSLYEGDKTNSSQVGKEMKIHIDPIFAKNGGGTSWSSEPNGAYNAQGVIFNHGKKFSAPKTSRVRKGVRAVRVINN
jgi:formylglycine-generating enzyme required for sulfatase activity